MLRWSPLGSRSPDFQASPQPVRHRQLARPRPARPRACESGGGHEDRAGLVARDSQPTGMDVHGRFQLVANVARPSGPRTTVAAAELSRGERAAAYLSRPGYVQAMATITEAGMRTISPSGKTIRSWTMQADGRSNTDSWLGRDLLAG